MRIFASFLLLFLAQVLWHFKGEAQKCEAKSPTLYFAGLSQSPSVVPRSAFSDLKPLFNDSASRIITSMSYDPKSQDLLFVDQTYPNRINWFRSGIIEFFEFEERFIEVAIDETTGNVYCIVGDYSIGVASLAKQHITLVPGPKEARSRHHLIVHPKRALMFWIDDSLKADSAKMANMDGTKIKQIQSSTVVKALALDPLNDFLYIADGPKIMRINLITMASTVVTKHATNFLFYFDCKLVFQNRNTNSMSVYDLDKKIGKGYAGLPLDILAVSAETPFRNITPIGQCTQARCAGICVLGEVITYPVLKCVTETPKKPSAKKQTGKKVQDEEVKSGRGWTFLFWIIGLAVMSVGAWWFFKRTEKGNEIWAKISTNFHACWKYVC